MRIVFGHIGSDAGYWYIGADGKIHRFPGWAPDAMSELSRAAVILGESAQLKTSRLGDATVKAMSDFITSEFNTHLKDGGVLVLTR
jgi:hypothetical protein